MGRISAALIAASAKWVARHGVMPAKSVPTDGCRNRLSSQPASANAPACPSALPSVTTSSALPRWCGGHRSAHSDNAAVSAPVVPIPASIRAMNSIGTLCALAVRMVPSVQTSARPMNSAKRLVRSTNNPMGMENSSSGTAAATP